MLCELVVVCTTGVVVKGTVDLVEKVVTGPDVYCRMGVEEGCVRWEGEVLSVGKEVGVWVMALVVEMNGGTVCVGCVICTVVVGRTVLTGLEVEDDEAGWVVVGGSGVSEVCVAEDVE